VKEKLFVKDDIIIKASMKKFVVFLTILLIFSGCKGRKVSRQDFLKDLDWYNFSRESSDIKIRPERAFYNFFEGWRPSGKYVFMTSPLAKIRFFHFSERDLYLSFFIKSGIFYREKESIKISFSIRGKKIATIRTTPEEKLVTIQLKNNDLLKGENFLLLEIGKEDKQFYEKYKWEKPHFLAGIKRLRFLIPEQPFFKKSNKGLIQPPNSSISFYSKAGGTSSLHLKFRKVGGRRGNRNDERVEIKITTTGGRLLKKEKLSLTEYKDVIKTLSFNLPENQIIGITLSFFSSNPLSRLLWKTIELEGEPILKNKIQPEKRNTGLKSRPDIFFIVLDAARYKEVKNLPDFVPNISSFAQDSFSFERFYSSAPYTSASVTSFMTGLYPEAHGVRLIQDAIGSNLRTLPDELRNSGYYTVMITGSVVPVNIGLAERFHKAIYIGKRGRINSSTMKEPLMLEALKKLKTEQPNFVYIHLLPPHEPYNPPPDFYKRVSSLDYQQSNVEKSKRKYERELNPPPEFVKWLYNCYLNNLYYGDYLVGKILDAIKDAGLYESSIIIITADHGEAFFEHMKFGHNTTNYEEMIHIPFLLKMPGQKEGRQVDKITFSNVDFAPTLYELLRIKPGLSPQGISFAPLLMGKPFSFPERWLYSRTISHRFNLALFNGNTKFYYNLGREELYDLNKDPGERYNLYFSDPVLSGYLKQKLFLLLKTNIEYNRRFHLKPGRSSFKKYLKELKSLGYL